VGIGGCKVRSGADRWLSVGWTSTGQVGRYVVRLMSKVALKMMTGTKVNGTTISPGVALGRGKAESGDASRYSDC
jgi:hypothetical protein